MFSFTAVEDILISASISFLLVLWYFLRGTPSSVVPGAGGRKAVSKLWKEEDEDSSSSVHCNIGSRGGGGGGGGGGGDNNWLAVLNY